MFSRTKVNWNFQQNNISFNFPWRNSTFHSVYCNYSTVFLPGPSKLATSYPDIGHLAKWTVSSHKFGFGIECLRDDDPDTFWQSVIVFFVFGVSYGETFVSNQCSSDGPQPHFITVQFSKKVAIQVNQYYSSFKCRGIFFPFFLSFFFLQKIALHLSYQCDDSYTPATLCIRAGTGLSDLQDVRLVTFQQPDGWLLFDVYMEPSEDGGV